MFYKNSIQKHLRERFFVTPKVGHNFSGVLISSCKEYHVFADVTVYPPETDPQQANGEIYIKHSPDGGNVAYCQRLPHAAV